MEEKLQNELNELFEGRQAKKDLGVFDLEYDEVLEADVPSEDEDDDYSGIKEYMGVQVDLDENDRIEKVCVRFHTGCFGDSGLGEEFPEDYWTYDECLQAAVEFVKDLLEDQPE